MREVSIKGTIFARYSTMPTREIESFALTNNKKSGFSKI